MVRNHAGIEELGIPCVSIVQDQFVLDAKATGEAYRLQNPALAVSRYVFAGLNESETREEVDRIIEDIITGLTKPLPEPREVEGQRLTTLGPKTDYISFRGKDQFTCFRKMNDKFSDWGWSDGFPIMPPTEGEVNEILKGTQRSPDDIVIERFVPGNASATVRNIAINAVMAGCKPEYLPVVLTAIETIHDPEMPTLAMTMSTGPHAPLFIVNGPISKRLNINSRCCALGTAGPERLSFSNVVIGRAVRLNLMNVGNCYPGVMDMDTIGSPTKFSMLLAENEEGNPWEPYHVEKGFKPEDSTISCGYGHSLAEVCDMESDTAAGLMNSFAIVLRGVGERAYHRAYVALLLMCPDHARILARDGWTKEDIRQYLYLHCRLSAEEHRRSCCLAYSPEGPRKWIENADSHAMIPRYDSPDRYQIIVVGGKGGKSAVYCVDTEPKPYLIKG